MTQTETPLSLTVERVIDAPAEKLFDAWLNPEILARFMCPGPGMYSKDVHVDPKVGGRFDLLMCGTETETPHGGVYKEIDRPNRLVFSWESPFSIEGSTVTLTFDQVRGGTKVTLHHVRFIDEEKRNNHQNGWMAILECLEGVA